MVDLSFAPGQEGALYLAAFILVIAFLIPMVDISEYAKKGIERLKRIRVTIRIAIDKDTENLVIDVTQYKRYKAGYTDVVVKIKKGVTVSTRGTMAIPIDVRGLIKGDSLMLINNGTINADPIKVSSPKYPISKELLS